ncbi:hypothetical protein Bbelb_108840 [Branchiostoma belcheri]|nr:hypothetical protein Bbelb_108840 [Branchiostoma belcheri]
MTNGARRSELNLETRANLCHQLIYGETDGSNSALHVRKALRSPSDTRGNAAYLGWNLNLMRLGSRQRFKSNNPNSAAKFSGRNYGRSQLNGWGRGAVINPAGTESYGQTMPLNPDVRGLTHVGRHSKLLPRLANVQRFRAVVACDIFAVDNTEKFGVVWCSGSGVLDSEPRGPGFESWHATDLVPLEALNTTFLTSLSARRKSLWSAFCGHVSREDSYIKVSHTSNKRARTSTSLLPADGGVKAAPPAKCSGELDSEEIISVGPRRAQTRPSATPVLSLVLKFRCRKLSRGCAYSTAETCGLYVSTCISRPRQPPGLAHQSSTYIKAKGEDIYKSITCRWRRQI